MEKDYARLIGEYILIFGNFETSITISIEIMCEKYFKSNCELNKVISKMLAMISSTYNKLKLMEYMVGLFDLNEQDKKVWDDFFEAMQELISRRNIYVHNMYGIKEENFIKFTNKKTVDGISVEKEFSYDDMQKDLWELSERYRQLFDSFIEKEKFGEVTWISHYPELKIC